MPLSLYDYTVLQVFGIFNNFIRAYDEEMLEMEVEADTLDLSVNLFLKTNMEL